MADAEEEEDEAEGAEMAADFFVFDGSAIVAVVAGAFEAGWSGS